MARVGNYKGRSRGHSNNNTAPLGIPTALDVAWAAGIFEGEGCVCWTPNGSSRTFKVQVTQKDPELLERLKYRFGGSIYGPARTRNVRDWRIFSSRALSFMDAIFDYLTKRRKLQTVQALKAVYFG